MNADQRRWMLAVMLAFVVGASANLAAAADPTFALTDAIKQIGDVKVPTDVPVDPALEARRLSETKVIKATVLEPDFAVPTDANQLLVERAAYDYAQEETILPIESHINHFGVNKTHLAYFTQYNHVYVLRRYVSQFPLASASRHLVLNRQSTREAFRFLLPGLSEFTDEIAQRFPDTISEEDLKYKALRALDLTELSGAASDDLSSLGAPFEPMAIATDLPSDFDAAELPLSEDDQLELRGFDLIDLAEVGSDRTRITVPAEGPAPIELDFMAPPAFDDGNDRRIDDPTRRAPQPSTEPPMRNWTIAMRG